MAPLGSSTKPPKALLKNTPFFCLVDTEELEDPTEWAEWLEALLDGPFIVIEEDCELVLAETRKLVTRVDGLRIEIYPNDHEPPHFHVRTPDIDAKLAIEDCQVLTGKLARGDLLKICYWHVRAKALLMECWESTRPTDLLLQRRA